MSCGGARGLWMRVPRSARERQPSRRCARGLARARAAPARSARRAPAAAPRAGALANSHEATGRLSQGLGTCWTLPMRRRRRRRRRRATPITTGFGRHGRHAPRGATATRAVNWSVVKTRSGTCVVGRAAAPSRGRRRAARGAAPRWSLGRRSPRAKKLWHVRVFERCL